jgi:hypothetical protein
MKDGFCEELGHVFGKIPKDCMKIVLEDFNNRHGKGGIFKSKIRNES